jgi:hypothetical protein
VAENTVQSAAVIDASLLKEPRQVRAAALRRHSRHRQSSPSRGIGR